MAFLGAQLAFAAFMLSAWSPNPSAKEAFIGADGYGRAAQGGRGGKIIQVTTLADQGPGSLRECMEAIGPRVCVFTVSGVIRFTSVRPIIRNPFITIAGETAPGGGIVLTHGGGKEGLTPLVIKKTHDVIVRHIRVRTDLRGEERGSNSAITIESSRNVIIDHVSTSWALDENIGGYGQNDLVTISSSIFAEGVPRHDKCALLSSDPLGPQKISFVRNLCAHNGDRNPDVNVMPGSCVDVVNNILYNAQSQFTEVWESYGGSRVNIVGNVYRRGPDTVANAAAIDRPLVESKGQARIYLSGNLTTTVENMSAAAKPAVVTAPVCPLQSEPAPAVSAYDMVLAKAGAFPRDAVDRRIVREVQTRTGKIGRPAGPIPAISSGKPYVDAERDGMADSWEKANGGDPESFDAWGDADSDGWSNMDEFLHYAHLQRIADKAIP